MHELKAPREGVKEAADVRLERQAVVGVSDVCAVVCARKKVEHLAEVSVAHVMLTLLSAVTAFWRLLISMLS